MVDGFILWHCFSDSRTYTYIHIKTIRALSHFPSIRCRECSHTQLKQTSAHTTPAKHIFHKIKKKNMMFDDFCLRGESNLPFMFGSRSELYVLRIGWITFMLRAGIFGIGGSRIACNARHWELLFTSSAFNIYSSAKEHFRFEQSLYCNFECLFEFAENVLRASELSKLYLGTIKLWNGTENGTENGTWFDFRIRLNTEYIAEKTFKRFKLSRVFFYFYFSLLTKDFCKNKKNIF